MYKVQDTDNEIRPLFEKMFEMVGADQNEIDMSEDYWFWKYEWTAKEQEKFHKWAIDFLIKQQKMSKTTAKKTAGMFILNVGWKTK